MHCLMKLSAIAALIAATVASPAPADAVAPDVVAPADPRISIPPTAGKQVKHVMNLSSKGPIPQSPDAATPFVGVVEMCTGTQCNGPSTEVWEIYGGPGIYGCLPIISGWNDNSVSFSQGIGDTPGCYAVAFSQASCQGNHTVVPVQSCLPIHYNSVSIQCVSI